MTHVSGPRPPSAAKDVSLLLEGDRLRSRYAAALGLLNRHYASLYGSLAAVARGLRLDADPFAEGAAAAVCDCFRDAGTLFRVRCEEECRQLEAQRNFLRAALAERHLACDRLRAEGRALRAEVDHVLPAPRSVRGSQLLSSPSSGEELLMLRRTAAASSSSSSLSHDARREMPAGSPAERTALLTLVDAAATVEEQIRFMEKELLRKGSHISDLGRRQLLRIPALRERLRDAQEALREDLALLEAEKKNAIEVEEKKARLLLEVEMMTCMEACETSLRKEVSERRELLAERAANAEEKYRVLKRILDGDSQGFRASLFSNDSNVVINENTKEEQEMGNELQDLQDAIQKLRTVREFLFALTMSVVSLSNDLEEIETVVGEVKSRSQSSPKSTGIHAKVHSWRSAFLQDVYDDAVRELSLWQAHESPTATAATKLLKKMRRLCIVNSIFSTHREALVAAVMGSGTSWREVQYMLPAAKGALALLRKKK